MAALSCGTSWSQPLDFPPRARLARMPELLTLDLITADGRPLVHKFYRHENDSDSLLVTFPGNHYGIDGPLLYYPSEQLRFEGWDTLAVSYGFQTARKEPFEEGLDGLLQECQFAVRAALESRDYSRVGLVGKSLGAAVVAHLCATDPDLAAVRSGYLTPALGTPFFDPLFKSTAQPAFVAVGTADRFYSADSMEALQSARPFELTLVEAADHSMNVPGDLSASLAAVERVVGDLHSFLTGGT